MTLESISTDRRKLSQYVFANFRYFLMAFILCTVIVVTTTDIRLVTISNLTDLGLEFFVLFFCSYGMYVCNIDGGVKEGSSTEEYKNAVATSAALKTKIETTCLDKMGDFCTYYVLEELKRTKMQYLSIACIPYDVYIEKYAKLGNNDIDALTELTSLQKKRIKKANKVKPIKLTPEMILSEGKLWHNRSALSLTPGVMKAIGLSIKIFKLSFRCLCIPLIAFDLIMDPSWTVFAGVCLKLFTVGLNGFDGHKDGVNIATYTVNYMNAKCGLMQEALLYATTKD